MSAAAGSLPEVTELMPPPPPKRPTAIRMHEQLATAGKFNRLVASCGGKRPHTILTSSELRSPDARAIASVRLVDYGDDESTSDSDLDLRTPERGSRPIPIPMGAATAAKRAGAPLTPPAPMRPQQLLKQKQKTSVLNKINTAGGPDAAQPSAPPPGQPPAPSQPRPFWMLHPAGIVFVSFDVCRRLCC